jgi:1-acyl-sn-glycerol-3-phosphate acyltransferase
MIATAVWNEHPTQRVVRILFSTWFASLPFFSALFVKLGHVPLTVENGLRLLEQEQLVAAFPEGRGGISKTIWQRYQLSSFGRGEFAKMALATQSPILPVAVVGAEETYLSIAQSPTAARLTGLPHFPITLRFPWLGLLGLVPLPTKWTIDFGPPILSEGGPQAAMDLMQIAALSDKVRATVQEMIDARRADRKSIFR